MISFTWLIPWCAAQVTLLALCGIAVYHASRRYGPSARAGVALISLLFVGLLTMASFSPWPRWWDMQLALRNTPATNSLNVSQPNTKREPTSPSMAVESPTLASLADEDITFGGSDLSTPTSEPPEIHPDDEAAATEANPFWSNLDSAGKYGFQFLSALLLVGCAIAIAQMGAGWMSVRRMLRQARPVESDALKDLLLQLCDAYDCPRRVDLRESAIIGTPATVGWRRPVILLPSGWTQWTPLERRTVLAHELAHIVRGDYPAWLAAVLARAMHFYHPLVRWLAEQLQVNQELAADEMAARHGGGAEAYRRGLAQLALRHDSQPRAALARSFLPSPSFLIRRIEMLGHQANGRPSPRAISRRRRLLIFAGLGIATLLIAGVRLPMATMTDKLLAEEPALDEGKLEFTVVNLMPMYVPQSARAVTFSRPGELYPQPKQASSWTASMPHVKHILPKLRPRDVPLMTSVNLNGPSLIASRFHIVRLSQEQDWPALLAKIGAEREEHEHGGKTYHVLTSNPDQGCASTTTAVLAIDAITVLLGSEHDVKMAIDAGPAAFSETARFEAASQLDAHPLVVALTPEALKFSADHGLIHNLLRNELIPGGAKSADMVLDGLQFAVMAMGKATQSDPSTEKPVEDADPQTLKIMLRYENGAQAQRGAETVAAVATLAKNAWEILLKSAPPARTREENDARQMLEGLAETLGKLDTRAEENQVWATSDSDATVGILALTSSASAAASRQRAMNNMKQVALALHNYYNTYRHFPPQATYDEEGNALLSWRVLILPFLEQEALYRKFHLDEPWDSPHNKKLIEKMPEVYGPTVDHLGLPEGSTVVLGVSGEGAAFTREGTQFKEFRDGMSMSAMLVETNTSIPWTQPLDLPIEAAKDPKQLGCIHPDGV
jgi:beta-lactamase regulating signal transducer with metallopeptidase domain